MLKPVATIRGTVIKGVMMGRKLGFPTINILFTSTTLPYGIYSCMVKTILGQYKGALHYGPRAVLGLNEPTLEVHLLDFSGDLYNTGVIIEVFDKIRDVINFDNIESLKKQIRLDVEYVRDCVIK